MAASLMTEGDLVYSMMAEESVDTCPAYQRTSRWNDPFAPTRIEEILSKVNIGIDLTDDQHTTVIDLMSGFADTFPGRVPLPMKVHQRPVTGAQKDWYNKILDDMEAAEIIQRVLANFIKCLSSTNLAPKEHRKTGMTKVEVLRKCNEQCKSYGLELFWEEVTEAESDREGGEKRVEAMEEVGGKPKVTKWRVCHAFIALNKATEVLPFPVGDLHTKQLQVAGKHWASVIDFASGYYALAMDSEAIPYTAFDVKG
ncbi:hypothetical protein M422DRAFT_43085 [Sphaerobolus stellatus SS14]|nr:hypothetical protein M422DRAFT_43085 [Sphaerobolus stellatus SS14]